METGIYVRVSTEEQAQEGFSIRAQEQKLKDYARIKEWSIYKIYADEGISGKNITERPAVNEMIEDIKNGHVKNVIVFKIDRLTRSTKDLITLVDLFNEYDCAFNSLMESIDTQTASGRMFLKIIGIFAEFERENIVERVTLGFERKVKEGYSLCGTASFGYDRKKGEKIQTINEEEAKIVREIFDMYVHQNLSFTDIAKRLNIRGIPTKENSVWISNKIRKVLKNCNYIGKVRYCINDEKRKMEIEGLHNPIIEEELFAEAQSLISKTANATKTKRPKANNYFCGFLYCFKCGKKLTTHNIYKPLKNGTMSNTSSYKCINILYKGCDSYSISHKKLEIAFQEYIGNILDFDVVDQITLKKQESHRQNNIELIQGYQSKYRKLENKEKEVINLYVDNILSFEEYRKMKKQIDDERTSITVELKKLEMPEEETSLNKEEIVANLKENWQHLNDNERSQFLLKFVRKIIIDSEKTQGEHFVTIKIVNVEFAN